MSFGTLQTVALMLMFLTPGALFIYVCALNYSPSMRARYLREQFPLELTIYYLVVSTVVHSFLLLIVLGIIVATDSLLQTHMLEGLTMIVTQGAVPGAQHLLSLTILVIIYFFSSLALAYAGGRLLRKRLMRPVPLWQDQLAEMQALAQIEQEPCRIELILGDRKKLTGNLLSPPQCWGEETDSFQLIVEDGRYTTSEARELDEDRIWVDSREIREMRLRVSGHTARFVFAIEKDE